MEQESYGKKNLLLFMQDFCRAKVAADASYGTVPIETQERYAVIADDAASNCSSFF